MPAWPATLPPLTELEDYTETPPDTLIVTPMSAGPPKLRRRFTAGVSYFSGRLRMTRVQVGILDDYRRDDLEDGALTVQATHPRSGAAVDAIMALPEYKYQIGTVWWVALQFMVLP